MIREVIIGILGNLITDELRPIWQDVKYNKAVKARIDEIENQTAKTYGENGRILLQQAAEAIRDSKLAVSLFIGTTFNQDKIFAELQKRSHYRVSHRTLEGEEQTLFVTFVKQILEILIDEISLSPNSQSCIAAKTLKIVGETKDAVSELASKTEDLLTTTESIKIQLDANGAHLTLIPWRRRVRAADELSEADMLIPYQRTTELVGREQEMDDLMAWVQSEHPISIRLITGGAGSGKTRIAIELMQKLAGLPDSTWKTGFIGSDEMVRFATQQSIADWGWPSDTLAVLDYAGTAFDQLSTWFKQLAVSSPNGKRLRLLLIEREAGTEQGWWEQLTGLGRRHSYTQLQNMFHPMKPVPLKPMTGIGHRRAILENMIENAVARTGGKRCQLPAPGRSADFERELGRDIWDRPLFLMMAGLCCLDKDIVRVLSMNKTELVEAVATREKDRLFDGFGGDLAVYMAAYSTLCRGVGRTGAMEEVKTRCKEVGRECPGGPGALVDKLRQTLPGLDDGLGFIEPDIIGEAVVIRALGALPAKTQDEVILRAAKMTSTAVPATVIRTVQDFAESNAETPLRWLEALIEAGAADDEPGLLFSIMGALPEQTVELRVQAVKVTELVLNRVTRLAGGDDSNPFVAMLLNNLSVRIGYIGRREDALGCAEKAVHIMRTLAEKNPDVYTPSLAISLSNLAYRLSDVGRSEDALRCAEEAVNIYRRQSQKDPDAFTRYLAGALSILANRLRDVGRREDGLARTEEAVDIYRTLVEKNPDAFTPDLAGALNNLSNRLRDVGQSEDALVRAEEAVDIYRRLVEKNPDAFSPYLATSLNNLANMLSDVGQSEDALVRAEEAVVIYRRLVEKTPDAFTPDLAMLLNNLANRLSEVGRREEALLRAEEAVGIYRTLAEQCTEAFAAGLAMSLNNLANSLSEVGRREDALLRAEEAVVIRRGLAKKSPDAFTHYYAMSLAVRGTCLRDLEKGNAAMDDFGEGLRVLLPYLLQSPQAFIGLAARIALEYLQTAEKCGMDPDMELLLPVIEIKQLSPREGSAE